MLIIHLYIFFEEYKFFSSFTVFNWIVFLLMKTFNIVWVLYVSWRQIFIRYRIFKYFSHSVAPLFTFLMMFFAARKFFDFDEVPLIYFCVLVSHLRNNIPMRSWRYAPMFSSQSFRVLGFTFELTFIYGRGLIFGFSILTHWSPCLPYAGTKSNVTRTLSPSSCISPVVLCNNNKSV